MRFGLRARVTLTYCLLALGLSSVLAFVTWTVLSRSLTRELSSTAVVDASDNAAAVRYGLDRSEPIDSLLRELPVTSGVTSLLYVGRWYTPGGSSLPADLVAAVRGGHDASRRVLVNGQPVLAVGVALGSPTRAYFELHSLAALDHTLRAVEIALLAGALGTALLGLAVGRLASTVALRPLSRLTDAAAEVARGRLGTRLEGEDDRSLGPLARSFNQTASALERRVAADARFAGDVSHELRTPLTTMLNSMELIRHRRAELPVSVREPVELLADDLERFRRLVLDLLEISRDDGGDAGSREVVLVGELVRAAADGAAGRSVTSVTPEAVELALEADKRRLERVVANLVQNAEEHGGGCLGVTVAAGGLGVVIRVDDGGPGVPAAHRERVFERFGRAGSDSDGRRVGLGLAIVARHVSWHEGTVRVEDRPGGGARFVVELPAVPTPRPCLAKIACRATPRIPPDRGPVRHP